MLYLRKPGSATETIQAIGFTVAPGASEPSSSVRVTWSEAFTAELARIAAVARASGTEASIPLASLRALLSAGLPGVLSVRSDLGLKGDDRPPFAQYDAPEADCARAVAAAVRSWANGPLRRWTSFRDLGDDGITALLSMGRSGTVAETARRDVDLLAADADPNGFLDARDAIHAAAIRRIAGTELFPGLGPVRALVRSRSRDNTVSFLTFPVAAERGSWSMRARLTVETLPGVREPFVRLDVSRVRWCPEIPTGMPFTQRNLTASVFGPDERRAVLFGADVVKGKVVEPEDPSYAMSALRAGVDPGEGFAAHVAAGPRNGAFVGIPYAPAYEPAPSMATGATELDWLDCFDTVAALMDGILVPIPVEAVPADRRVSRSNEDIPAVKAATVLEDVARTLGHNDVDDEAIADAWRVLHGDELPKGLAVPPKAAEATRRFDELREANTARIRSTFGADVPAIVVLSARADEGAAVAEVVRTLFSGRMRVENRLLPVGVHGPRADLDKADRPARQRYEARLAAWKPLAEGLAEEFGAFRAIVHAPKWRDDTVNKIAGRIALARYGNCNAQYLDARGRKADEWFFRIQASVLDLMFGHSGVVSPIAEHVAEAFPEATTRPRTVVGVSVVSQARTASQAVSSFFLAVTVDVASGRTEAVAARPKDGTLDFVGPAAFFEVLKSVASWDGARLENGDAAKADFQDFLDEVVRPACERGERPLVLVDGANARNLWPTLSDRGWAGPHSLGGRPFDVASDWPGARLVRVQGTEGAKIVTRKERTWIRLDAETGREVGETVQRAPTLTEPGRLVRILGPATNYVSSGDLDGQQKLAKGLSVYRLLDQFKALAEGDVPPPLAGRKVFGTATRDLLAEPYKLPGTVGILVVHAAVGDDPDRVAALCHGLRTGFGHSRSPARMPAPLFQAAKVAEYIPAFVLGDADDAATAVDGEDAAEPDPEGDVLPPVGVANEKECASVLPAPTSNPLLFLSAVRPLPAFPSQMGQMNAQNPIVPAAPASSAMSIMTPALGVKLPAISVVPPEVRALAEGDALLERIVEEHWVGPLPSFATIAWFHSVAAGHSSIRTRQAVASEMGKLYSPVKRFMPELDPRSDTSFAEFILALMCVADGIAFLRDAMPRATLKAGRRWIFNNFYDTVFHRAKPLHKGNADGVVLSLVKTPHVLLKKLHDAGNADLVRSYLVLEVLFMVEFADRYADAATKLAEEYGEEYAEVSAFCHRVARYNDNVAGVKATVVEYTERVVASLSHDRVPSLEMPDLHEVTNLDAIPSVAVPSRIDPNWIREKIALSGAFRSHLHGHRALFAEVLGSDRFWPEDKPTSEQLVARVQRMFSFPQPLLGAVSHRGDESLFRSFYRKIDGIVRTGTPPVGGTLGFPADWETEGWAPKVVKYLLRSGYRDYAADLAILRAVENPSLPLEWVVEAAGPEFAEVAAFVRSRRRATLWFEQIDPLATIPAFARHIAAFREGERSATRSVEAADEEGVPTFEEVLGIEPVPEEAALETSVPEADGAPPPPEAEEMTIVEETFEEAKIMEEATQARNEAQAAGYAGSAGSPIGPDPLATALIELSRAASEIAHFGAEASPQSLDAAVEDLTGLLERVRAEVAALPRDVDNTELIGRAEALRTDATVIAEKLGEAVRLPAAPAEGTIAPAAAAEADGLLLSGESAAAEAKVAIREVDELTEKARSARLNEIGAINSQVSARVSDVQVGLAGVIDSLKAAMPLLVAKPAGSPPPRLKDPVPVPPAAPEARPVTAEAKALPEMALAADLETDAAAVAVDTQSISPSSVDAAVHEPEQSVAEEAISALYELRKADAATRSDIAEVDDEAERESDIEVLERLAVEAHPESVADVPPAEAAPGEDFEDPENARIDTALDCFMAFGDFGLAHHLARAAEAEGRRGMLATTSDEAKLAAIAGHLNHTALQSRVDLVDEWVRAGHDFVLTVAADPDRERASARLLAVMPLMAELGIFFPSSGADEVLRSFAELPGELGDRANDVFEAVSRIRRTNITFTRAMLANVANELDRFEAMKKARAVLLAKAEHFAIMKFDFQLGMKIRNELSKSDGLVGRLRLQLVKNVDDDRTAELLRDFVVRIPDRSRIVQLLDDTEEKVNFKFRGIDGAARDRFVGVLASFRDEASNYLELRAEIDSAKQSERPKARQFAMEISRALGGMVAAVEASALDQGRLGVAAGHAAPRLRKVANILAGDASIAIAPMADAYHACHAEMAFVHELDFGRSWLPSPYEPGHIIDVLCSIEPPMLPPAGAGREAFFDAAVRERIGRGSYVGARMLLDAADFFSIPSELRSELNGELEVNLTTARQSLVEDCAQVRKTVERVIRFGSLRQAGGADRATLLLDRVDKIASVQVPILVTPEERTEQEEVEGIYDVSVAIDVLEDASAEAQALLDEPRLRLLRRVDEMAAMGTDPVLVDRLKTLCQLDDLLTAEEYIEDAAKTGVIPESRNLNWRFAEFSQVVLPKLAHHKRDLAQEVTAALRDGKNFEAIRYGALGETRRAESEEIVLLWRELFRRFNDQNLPPLFSTFLDRIGIRAEMKDIVERPNGPRKMLAADFRAEFDADQESLLLPDFGSRTEGWYRIAVMQSLPNDSTVATLCSAAKHGVIAFVGDTVSQEQRKQFHVRNLDSKRRIILVDSASLFYALGEPLLRPLTLIELGQPYSYVAPYHDWGRDAVPQEMFVGRAEDIGHIFDTEGSCVVYGGRRMGKTAILRHLRATKHDPDSGTLVAFVDAQEIGKGPTPTNRVWGEIAASLPEVFGKLGTLTDGKRVRAEIKRWLDDDQRRRVLMLIDECDLFVVADASQNYVEFLALQQLMTETKRRFKFVLSGLSDVTRLVQTGNPPLKQISANPRRIGSLTGPEHKDAENLVLRPFAAIGVTIQRTDVWRILSHANYYPVLIQTYAERLLQLIFDRARQSQKPIRDVGSDLVAEVMDDHKVREEINRIFQFTLGIDLRYRLIAYVVASLVFESEAEGRISDGFPVREIRDLSLKYWEAGFQDKNRFSLFDDLLDEMEGLGIVRRVNDLWTLRSSAVVRLLGNRTEIEDKIADFFEMEAPVGFDPKSHRRELPPTKGYNTERKSSPLTLGQERDILFSKARATLVLGNKLADYALAPAALESVPNSFSDGGNYEIRLLRPASGADLEASLRELSPSAGRKAIAIVPAASPWTSDWVRASIVAKAVATGKVRVVFVGGPEHASSVFADEQLASLTAHVAQVPLEPWSNAYFQDRVNSNNSVALSQRFDAVVAANGGWNDPMWQLLKLKGAARLAPDAPDPEAIGLTGRFGDALRRVPAINGDGAFTAADVDTCAEVDSAFAAIGVGGQSVIDYGILMGLLVPSAERPKGEDRRPKYELSALAAHALGLATAVAAE